MSPYEILGFLTGVLGVYLTTRQNIWSWPVGIVNVAIYAYVFYQYKLYADMSLQVIYVFLCFYGWYHWLHGGGERDTLPVSRTTPLLSLGLLALGAAGSALMGTFLYSVTDADLPYLDSTLAAFSLVAQWMMTVKRLECWFVWIAVDLAYVGMYLYKSLHLTAGLYFIFLLLAAKGYLDWKRSMDEAVKAG